MGAAMGSCYCQRDCAPAARSIYVIGENRHLYRFEASTASLHLVGAGPLVPHIAGLDGRRSAGCGLGAL